MFRRLLQSGAIALGSMVLISSVNADVLNQRDTQNGTLTNIVDTTVGGNVTSQLRTINIVQNELIRDVSVTIEGLQHTWVGDLVATLRKVGPGNSTLASTTLFNRILRDGIGPGDSSNFGDGNGGGGNYTFVSREADPTNASNPDNIWSVADDDNTLFDIPESQAVQLTASTFAQTLQNSYAAVNESGVELSLANAFAGQSTAGTWEFRIEDQMNREVGSFTGVTLNFSAVPEPSSLGLLAAGAVGFFYLRRRKKTS